MGGPRRQGFLRCLSTPPPFHSNTSTWGRIVRKVPLFQTLVLSGINIFKMFNKGDPAFHTSDTLGWQMAPLGLAGGAPAPLCVCATPTSLIP